MKRFKLTDETGALPSRFAAWEVPIGVFAVRGLLELVERSGCSREPIAQRLGSHADRLHLNDARILYGDFSELCELAVAITGDSGLGLHWAEQVSPQMFGPMSCMLTRVRSLRQAFQLVSQFGQLFCDEPFLALTEHEDAVAVRAADWLSYSARMPRFSVEFMLAGLARMVRTIAGDDAIQRVFFAYGAPDYYREYERVFGAPVRFERPFSGIVMSRALLDRPAPHADRDVQLAIQSVAEKRLRRIVRAKPHAWVVRQFLLKRLPDRVTMDVAARSLGFSVRTLRRQLASEGTSFRELEYAALGTASQWLLRDPQRTTQQIALELGFSDTAAFRHAFKRWTGQTPGRFRAHEAHAGRSSPLELGPRARRSIRASGSGVSKR